MRDKLKIDKQKGLTLSHFYSKDCRGLSNITFSNYRSRTGFTLIELLIYIALVSGILIVATTFAWNVINSRTKAFAVQEVQQNGRFIMEKITRAAQGAIDINSPAIGESGNLLNLVMEDSQQDPVIFEVSGGRLRMSQAGGAFIEISSNRVMITNIEFKNLSTPDGRTRNIKVNLTLEHLNPDNRPEWQFSDIFSTAIELRDR